MLEKLPTDPLDDIFYIYGIEKDNTCWCGNNLIFVNVSVEKLNIEEILAEGMYFLKKGVLESTNSSGLPDLDVIIPKANLELHITGDEIVTCPDETTVETTVLQTEDKKITIKVKKEALETLMDLFPEGKLYGRENRCSPVCTKVNNKIVGLVTPTIYWKNIDQHDWIRND